MKKCYKCNIEKEDKFFNKKRDTLSSYCKDCNKIIGRDHYNKNKSLYGNRNRERRDNIRKFIILSKENKGCTDCGKKFHFSAMDYDHLGNKSFSISESIAKLHSIKKIQLEIEKCELVCSNCHRVRTYNRLK